MLVIVATRLRGWPLLEMSAARTMSGMRNPLKIGQSESPLPPLTGSPDFPLTLFNFRKESSAPPGHRQHGRGYLPFERHHKPLRTPTGAWLLRILTKRETSMGYIAR